MAISFKHLGKDVDRFGNVRIYFRTAGRPQVRLRSPEGSPEFAEEYAAALSGKPARARKPRPQVGPDVLTMDRLVSAFLGSENFTTGRGADAQDRLKKRLQWVCTLPVQRADPDGPSIGQTPVQAFDADFVNSVFNRCETIGIGYRVRAYLVLLFDWGMQYKRSAVSKNPAREYKPFVKRPTRKHHKRWTSKEIERFREAYPVGTMARLAMELIFESAARRSDAWRLGPQHIVNGKISFIPKKTSLSTGVGVNLPLSAHVLSVIAATPAANKNLVFLVGDRGRPFKSEETFGKWFNQKARDAGLPEGFTAHGLRRSAATEAAWAGATSDELMSLGGWTRIETARGYVDEADRLRNGENIAKKRLAYRAAE